MTRISLKNNHIYHLTEQTYQTLYQQSISDPETFWHQQAQLWLTWESPWTDVLTGSFNNLPITWFKNGKLNISVNCIDRHLTQHADKTAIYWQGNEPGDTRCISYQTLFEETCRAANVLKHLQVQKGDVVCLYLPLIPEAIFFMLACARIGAVHNVVFAGFASESLRARIEDSQAKIVITSDGYQRGDKHIPLKSIVDQAVHDCEHVQNVIVHQHLKTAIDWIEHRDLWLHELQAQVSTHCVHEIMDSDDPLFILYTSGSTGAPKGILHTTGGYALYATMTYYHLFNHQNDSIHWCTADIGWITGHTYTVYGPLLNGASIVIYEGVPNYPNYSRYWEIIDKFKITNFYTSPTALRALRHEGNQWITPYHLSSLKVLGSVGEPINPEVWTWYFDVIGHQQCPIVNTWWQTESGGVLLSPLPSQTEYTPGSGGLPFFGIQPHIDNDKMLYIKNPWPGMLKTIYKNHERFLKAYFPEPDLGYLTGDGAYQDDFQEYHITGRLDDIIKVSGHRIGSAELENALISHPLVSESAIVGIPHDIKGECIIAFIIPKQPIHDIKQASQMITQHLRKTIGPLVTPERIYWVSDLPKTRSGKIMRRILRKIAIQENDFGDISSLSNPDVISKIIEELQMV